MSDNNTPIILYVEQETKKLFNELLDKGPLKGIGNKNIFILAVVYGYKKGTRIKIKKKESFTRMEYLNKEDKSLLYSIAIKEKESLDILNNKNELYSIVEEYANAGIKIIESEIKGKDYGDYNKRLEDGLYDIVNELNL